VVLFVHVNKTWISTKT